MKNIAILGLRENDLLFGHLIEKTPGHEFNLIGYIADTNNYDKNNKAIIGEIDEIETLATTHQLQKIFVTPSKYFKEKNAKKLLEVCNKIGLKLMYVMMNAHWNEKQLNDPVLVNSIRIYNPQKITLDNISKRLLKRFFDIVFSTVVIIFLFSWLLPIIALLIKFDSKGPIIIQQQRTGIDNKVFNCLKFRAIHVNKETHSKQAQVNDSRNTPTWSNTA